MVRIGEILVLDDDRRFVVVSTANIDDKQYCYLAEFLNPDYTKICQVKGNSVVLVEDEKLINQLEHMFIDSYEYF